MNWTAKRLLSKLLPPGCAGYWNKANKDLSTIVAVLWISLLLPWLSAPAWASESGHIYEVGDIVALPVNSLSECPVAVDRIELLLDGNDTGLRPMGCDPALRILNFRLSPKDAKVPSTAAWAGILGEPWSSPGGVRKFQVTLSVPKPDGSGFVSLPTSNTIQIRVVGTLWPVGVLLFAGVLTGLVLLGKRSGMLRDANCRSVGLWRPYSLSRVQMAWWFILVFGACIGLWVTTGDWPVLNVSSLALLGVSGVTGVVSISIDSSPDRVMPETAGFWRDILTDVQGVTLARFQLLVWNLALGFYFVSQVVANLQIPEFDATTLGLLGISAVAYAGLKIPEKQS
jgi:hypothetical protein